MVTLMRIIVADCTAVYTGRLNASLPLARRVLLIKEDSSCLIFSELGSYKPLNWMAAPCMLRELEPDGDATALQHEEFLDAALQSDAGASAAQSDEEAMQLPEKIIRVNSTKSDDVLTVSLMNIVSDQYFALGTDPGLTKDGVEDHLQRFLAQQIERLGEGTSLVRREYPTAIGPVDIMAVDAEGKHVAVEIKRHGGIDGVEQLTRYCELLNRDPLLAPVRGVFAAQTITPQAKTLAEDRGFSCLLLDYEDMKGVQSDELTLF
jgi:RecB family endonuclease NucS